MIRKHLLYNQSQKHLLIGFFLVLVSLILLLIFPLFQIKFETPMLFDLKDVYHGYKISYEGTVYHMILNGQRINRLFIMYAVFFTLFFITFFRKKDRYVLIIILMMSSLILFGNIMDLSRFLDIGEDLRLFIKAFHPNDASSFTLNNAGATGIAAILNFITFFIFCIVLIED